MLLYATLNLEAPLQNKMTLKTGYNKDGVEFVYFYLRTI